MNPFKVGNKVQVIESGYGIGKEHIGKITVVTDVSETAYRGVPGIKVADFKNHYYNDWIGIKSFALFEDNWENLDPENKKKFIKQLLGSLYIDETLYGMIKKLINK